MASTIILSDNGVSSGSAGLKETGGNDGVLILQTTTSGGTATNALYIDNNQNAGLAATPTAAPTNYKFFAIGNESNGLYGYKASFGFQILSNAKIDGTTWKYSYSGPNTASRIDLNDAAAGVTFFDAPAGSANSTISWTQTLAVSKNKSLALEGATSQTGTGITFPATQNASSDVNTLDDYEEGTWTPVVYGTTTAGTCSYSTQAGRYIKIGKMVTISCAFGFSSHTGTGNCAVSGLPFASVNASGYESVTVVGDGNMQPPAGRAASFYICAATYIISGYVVTTGGSAGGAPLALPSTGSAWFNITYEAAA
jgi:hypothetical protein